MSLKSFHVFFIVTSIILGFGFGFWCLDEWRYLSAPFAYVIGGGLSFLTSFGLIFYLRLVVKKLKGVSYL